LLELLIRVSDPSAVLNAVTDPDPLPI